MSVLKINNLGKSYRRYRSELHRIGNWFGLNKAPCEENWVLRHINFDIKKGEVIGLIGRNGAGKSSLLKMITGTTHPNEGSIEVKGRIAAILELGMGFNPNMTGRQNAYYAASIMGFSQGEIDAAIEDIENFTDIAEYFDAPMRTYSSGMQARLSFAVATAWRPEILIVDEVLSVGDMAFQAKCFQRIRAFKEEGTTLLIVSHDKSAVLSLCDRLILIEKGTLLKDGVPEEVFDYYNALVAVEDTNTVEITQLENGKVQTLSGTQEARITQIALQNSKGETVDTVIVGETVNVKIQVEVYEDIPSLVLGCGIKNLIGEMIFGSNTYHYDKIIPSPQKGDLYEFTVSFDVNLGTGGHSIHVSLTETDNHIDKNFHMIDCALTFNVINIHKPFFVGHSWNDMHFDYRKKDK